MNLIYEAGLSELISFLTALLNEAFRPYGRVFRGRWQADSIEKEARRAFESAMKRPPLCPYEGRRLSSFIDNEVRKYLLTHTHGFIYGPDLAAYGKEIGEKLEEIVVKTTTNMENANF